MSSTTTSTSSESEKSSSSNKRTSLDDDDEESNLLLKLMLLKLLLGGQMENGDEEAKISHGETASLYEEISSSMKEEDIQAVAAIDLGTAASVAAFCAVPKNRSDFSLKNVYIAHLGDPTMTKTPTHILFDEKKKMVAFGSRALDEYKLHLEEMNKNETFLFFERLKMHLFVNPEADTTSKKQLASSVPPTSAGFLDLSSFQNKPVPTVFALNEAGTKRVPLARAANNQFMEVKDIISAAMRYIVEQTKEKIRDSFPNTIDESKIKWVFTVPAIWNEWAKKIMIETAREVIGKNAIIELALEPECASICVLEQFPEIKSGRHIILDLGGGTADFAAHEVMETVNKFGQKERVLKTLCAPTGGDWGSSYIDEQFKTFMLKEILGTQMSVAIKLDLRANIMPQWSKIKESLTATNQTAFFSLNLATIAQNADTGIKFEDIQRNVAKANSKLKLESQEQMKIFKSMTLHLPKKLIESFFQDSTRKIVQCTESILEKVKDVDHIFMVGGMGNSPVIQAEVKKAFEATNKVKKVIIPLHPVLSVVHGAVLHGLSPSIIASRIMNRSLGVAVAAEFDSAKHDPKYKQEGGLSRPFVSLFSKFVSKDESIPTDHTVENKYSPASVFSRHAKIEIYSSSHPDPMYIGEDTKLEASMLIPLSFSLGGNSITVIMKFGGTQVAVEAIDEASKKRYRVDIQFAAPKT